MNGESLNITQDQIEKLKSVFPEAITEGKIDWEKLQASLGNENAEFKNERYVLNWAGKAEAFKVLQQSTTATLKPVPMESINFDTTENVFIEGENLEVLKVLQKAYYGEIKFVIIDPPYNTGNDGFIYPDSFKESRGEYQKRIGEKDEDGYLMKEGFFRRNSKDSGHYHSNWLSMMYPRLFLAKNLLRDDGVIFVHIDDNEVHNLRLIMNEIFGEENFIASFIWKKRSGGGYSNTLISTNHEYIICFSKNDNIRLFDKVKTKEWINEYYDKEDSISKYKLRDMRKSGTGDRRIDRPTMFYEVIAPDGTKIFPMKPNGEDGRWSIGKKTFEELSKSEIEYIKQRNGWKVYLKERNIDEYGNEKTEKYESLLVETPLNSEGTSEIEDLFGDKNIFTFPKPSGLIKRFIAMSSIDDDKILDFFAGSATTAQAVLEQNKEDGGKRKFILVQLPEPCDLESEAYKAGYKTIAEISKERIRRVIQKIEKEKNEKPELFENGELDLGFKVFKLSSSNFKIWRGSEITEENLEEQLDAFTNPVKEESETENMLYELILKSGYLLTDKIEKNAKYYSVKNGELIIALEEMTQKLIDKIIIAKPKKVITLDKLFTGNDQLKTNTVLQMKDAEIDFKTI